MSKDKLTDSDNSYTRSGPLPRGTKWQPDAIFTYCDQHGAAVFEVHRQIASKGKHRPVTDEQTGKTKKRCFQRWLNAPDGKKPPNAPVLPYRLPELIKAVAANQIIYIAEGEPKVEALRKWGLAATCSAEGAGKWKVEHAQFLRGADVVILPDNDAPGRGHADKVGHLLTSLAKRCRLLELPGLAEHGDVVDWVAAGGTHEQFEQLVAATTEWKPYKAEVAPVKTAAAGFPDVTKNGRPRSSLPNTKVALAKMGLECRHDLFKLRYLINGKAIESFVGEVSDPALLRVRERIHECFGFDPSTQTVHTAVQTLANHHRFHPVRDYLDGLKWDGVSRIDSWLTQYAGADDSEYARAVGALVLVAAVRRVREPGCKFDEILVLENPEQGNNKSSALQVLAVKREWFSDNLPLGLSAKETIEALSGHWIIEASELHGMRKSDIDKVKAFASRDTDRARLAYDRAPTAAPRQCVIIGTTNNEQYLRDLSGNRRFWPVRIVRFDLEVLLRDRDQLWAEAAARETSGASIRLPERLWAAAAREQQERVVENPFVSVLDSVLREKSDVVNGELVEGKPMQGKIAAEDVWAIVGVRVAQRSQDRFELLGDAMKQLGWVRTRLRVGDNQRAYHYVRGPQPHRRISVVLVGNGDGTPAVPVAGYDNENFALEVSLPVPPVGEWGEGQG